MQKAFLRRRLGRAPRSTPAPPAGAPRPADAAPLTRGPRSLHPHGTLVCVAVGFMSAQRLRPRRRWAVIPPRPGCQATAQARRVHVGCTKLTFFLLPGCLFPRQRSSPPLSCGACSAQGSRAAPPQPLLRCAPTGAAAERPGQQVIQGEARCTDPLRQVAILTQRPGPGADHLLDHSGNVHRAGACPWANAS